MTDPYGIKISSFGKCIYCFRADTQVELTDEHIWPESLYGYDVILKGSCRECASALSKLDGYLARKVYYDLRLRCGIKSKKKSKKDHPTTAVTHYYRNHIKESVQTPIVDKGFSIALPKFGPPGILCGRQPERFFGEMGLEIHGYFEEVAKYILAKPGDIVQFHDAPSVNPLKFARSIIKIAYCIGIGAWGIDSFTNSLLPAMILGADDRYPYVIGSPPDPTPSFIDMDYLHSQEFLRFGSYLAVRVRPFATCGSTGGKGPVGFPIYEVVLGEIRDDLWRRGPPSRIPT